VVTLTVQEREQLQRWARRAKSAQMLAQRAKFVLACADGVPGGWREFGLKPHRTDTFKLSFTAFNIADGTRHRPARPTCVEAGSTRK
jgi:hypothetical protein